MSVYVDLQNLYEARVLQAPRELEGLVTTSLEEEEGSAMSYDVTRFNFDNSKNSFM